MQCRWGREREGEVNTTAISVNFVPRFGEKCLSLASYEVTHWEVILSQRPAAQVAQPSKPQRGGESNCR